MLTLSAHLETYLIIGAMLFGFGIYGLLHRPSLIGMFISVELLLCGASVNFMAFNRFLVADPNVGQLITLFIMAIAAAEAAIGLSIVIAVYRNYKTIDAGDLTDLKG